MKKNSYFFFFISLAFALGIALLIGYFSFNYVYDMTKKELIESRIEASKQEALHMTRLLAQKLKDGYTQQQVITEFQKSIQYTPTEKSFECMFNHKGVQLCHPDPAKIGQVIDSTNSVVSLMNNEQFKENFESVLQKGKPGGGMRSFLKKKFTEIIYVAPVEGSDLMLAVHANLVYIKNQLKDFREKLLYVFIISGLLMALVTFVFIRFLYIQTQHRNKFLQEEKMPLPENPTDSVRPNSTTKPQIKQNRILANQGNKLVPLLTEDVAYAYIEYKLTYLVNHKGDKFTSNLSLEELLEQLDPHKFFRANRQFIVSIKGITKVEKYGNSQLRVKVKPETDKEIIISKLKMAAFKKWMGKK